MKMAAVLLSVATIAAVAGGAQQATDPTLDKLADAFADAFNAKNAAKVASYYADDAIVMPPGEAMIRGRANIEAYYARGFEQDVSDFRLSPMESAIAGGQAFEAGRSRLTYRRPTASRFGPGSITQPGKYVVIYKRVGREWKIAYDIFNND